MRFGRGDFDRDTALQLASGWCSRLTQLWSLWLDSGEDPDFWDMVDESMVDMSEIHELLAKTERGTALWQRAQDVLAVQPRSSHG